MSPIGHTNSVSLTLPKGFLAPNLHRLALPSISPPRRLWFLTPAISLVTLVLINIQTSSYFRPRLLVARLLSLPQIEELSIGLSTPIPRPSTEREFSKAVAFIWNRWYLKSGPIFWSGSRSGYLTKSPRPYRTCHTWSVSRKHSSFPTLRFSWIARRSPLPWTHPFQSPSRNSSLYFRVICKLLDWQIACAAEICHARISHAVPCGRHGHSTIASGMSRVQDLLRSLVGVKELYIIEPALVEELSRALQADGVVEPGQTRSFYPTYSLSTELTNLFASFIDTRQVVGRPVQ